MFKPLPIVRNFVLQLDKSQLNYKAGEQVKGHCLLNIDGVLQITNLDINMICEGSVDFKENKSDKKTMTFLIEKYDLMKKAGIDQTLRGEKKIDFCFSIPEVGYPSSFHGKFGFIRYKIEVIIHKDWDVFRKEIIFNITTPFNGYTTEIFKPIARKIQKKVGHYHDFIELYAKLDKGWFTRGDKVSVYCNVINNTDQKLKLLLSLHQKQNYWFTKIKTRINNEQSYDYIDPQCKSYSKRILLSIPSNLKTMSVDNKLIEISYEIRALIEVVGSKDPIKVDLPIVLTMSPKVLHIKADPEPLDQLPPSYSDCQIFQRFASEDILVYFPAVNYNNEAKFTEENIKSNSLEIVDLPPTYAEAVFGNNFPD